MEKPKLKCCICGQEKDDVEVIVPNTEPICDACFGKVVKYLVRIAPKLEQR